MQAPFLIFDLDGTLIDSRSDLATAVNLVRRHYGLPGLPENVIGGFVGDGIRALVLRSLEGANADLDEAVKMQQRFYAEHMADRTVLYPGVEAGLNLLVAAGCRLAVASNKLASLSEAILRHFGVRDLFCRVAGDGNTARLKPDPAMITETMAFAGAGRGDTWVIGDGHTDLESARRAGVRSVFVTYGIGTRGKETPTLTCASFGELPAIFAPGGMAARTPA